MDLLDFPQEVLDQIASSLNYFDLIKIRGVPNLRELYHHICNDEALRQALINVEIYWSEEAQVRAVATGSQLFSSPSPPGQLPLAHIQPYPSYQNFLNQAPCYSCLRITDVTNTIAQYQRPGDDHRDYQAVAMLPWKGTLGTMNRNLIGVINTERKCIDCTIRAAKDEGKPQKWLLAMCECYHFYCTNCHFKVITRFDLSSPPYDVLTRSVLCPYCFHATHTRGPGQSQRTAQGDFVSQTRAYGPICDKHGNGFTRWLK